MRHVALVFRHAAYFFVFHSHVPLPPQLQPSNLEVCGLPVGLLPILHRDSCRALKRLSAPASLTFPPMLSEHDHTIAGQVGHQAMGFTLNGYFSWLLLVHL